VPVVVGVSSDAGAGYSYFVDVNLSGGNQKRETVRWV
jgi:hypothetical protein